MFENMSGFVGHTMHEERQRQARKDRPAREAARAVPSSWMTANRRCRTAVSSMLVAIAARLAPTEVAMKADLLVSTEAR